MNLSSSRAIRRAFLEYFKDKGHKVVESSPLIPQDDPTLLFTNAGMVQFKRVFLGEEKRPYKRAVSCQKCVRAGGKHNDLENVGYTARHHTFFEMLGNFSFGDYFKEEAIEFGWDFLTNVIGLPKDRLWITVYKDDKEARRLWQRIAGISYERIIGLGEKDNFWAMGDTGPCGPCSEILIDQGEGVGCKRPSCKVGCDCDRYLELWNLVFMQYFRDEAGKLHPLPRPSIDTGMGLERISAVCQEKLNNFDTDLFSGIISSIEAVSQKKYGAKMEWDVAMRVISDHARASAFLISDGVMPSNEGRGFVLRRIIRRSLRYGRTLGLNEPFMAHICKRVIEEMKDPYHELASSYETVKKVVTVEEERFLKTLDLGLDMLSQEIKGLKNRGKTCISGEFAFKLYDTYGLPIDIVQDIAKEQGLSLDRKGYEENMRLQKERSKKASKDTVIRELPKEYQELTKKGAGGEFCGYDTCSCKGRLLCLYGGKTDDSKEWEFVKRTDRMGWRGEAVFSITPFYAEAGGQVGDSGEIRGEDGRLRAICNNTIRRGGLICHLIELKEGELVCGNDYELTVLEGRRRAIERNHTATHLLHSALREILGGHVQQSGSLVEAGRLRFDFSYFSKVDKEKLNRIEAIVNQEIRNNTPVETELMSIEEAKKKGAIALFGEKYGETVRVVRIDGFSMELCGGTHVRRTGSIGLFKILHETGIASNIRRIEAVTGKEAIEYVQSIEDRLIRISGILKSPVNEVEERVATLSSRLKAMQKEIDALRLKGTAIDVDEMIKSATLIDSPNGAIHLISQKTPFSDPKAMRGLGDKLKNRLKNGVIVLGGADKKKAMLLVMVTKALSKDIHAGELIRPIAKIVGGGGGGRPDMAQAGGPLYDKLDEAISGAEGILREFIKSKNN